MLQKYFKYNLVIDQKSHENKGFLPLIFGLTLIEVLVALAIVAIAMLAVIKATGQALHSEMRLKDKTLALWVGTQVANEWRAGLLTVSDSQTEFKTIILNRTFYWRAQVMKTPNPRIDKFIVSVYTSPSDTRSNQNPLEVLQTYRYQNERL